MSKACEVDKQATRVARELDFTSGLRTSHAHAPLHSCTSRPPPARRRTEISSFPTTHSHSPFLFLPPHRYHCQFGEDFDRQRSAAADARIQSKSFTFGSRLHPETLASSSPSSLPTSSSSPLQGRQPSPLLAGLNLHATHHPPTFRQNQVNSEHNMPQETLDLKPGGPREPLSPLLFHLHQQSLAPTPTRSRTTLRTGQTSRSLRLSTRHLLQRPHPRSLRLFRPPGGKASSCQVP